jgi:Nucleotidyl transferase AbiEii toxin, Type IV TA system
MQLYILESFLARLAATRFVERLVLKGGVLLPAFGERRPTRDIDLQAQAFDNDPEAIRLAIVQIAAVDLDDGVVFDVESATTEVIRDEDAYHGVRVTMTARLATARAHFHVDVSVGDPITPAPEGVGQAPMPVRGSGRFRQNSRRAAEAVRIVSSAVLGLRHQGQRQWQWLRRASGPRQPCLTCPADWSS